MYNLRYTQPIVKNDLLLITLSLSKKKNYFHLKQFLYVSVYCRKLRGYKLKRILK